MRLRIIVIVATIVVSTLWARMQRELRVYLARRKLKSVRTVGDIQWAFS